MSNWVLHGGGAETLLHVHLQIWPNILYMEQFMRRFIEAYKNYLPASSCSAVERVRVTDPRVDVIQTQLSLRSGAYCHCDECGIAMWWLPFGVWRRGGGWDERGRISFSSSFSLSLPSLLPRAEAAHSQLRQPVDAGQTGVQLWRHGQGSGCSAGGMRHSARFWCKGLYKQQQEFWRHGMQN